MERTGNQSQFHPSIPSPNSGSQDLEEGPTAECLTHTLAWHPNTCLGTWFLTSTLGLVQKALPL